MGVDDVGGKNERAAVEHSQRAGKLTAAAQATSRTALTLRLQSELRLCPAAVLLSACLAGQLGSNSTHTQILAWSLRPVYQCARMELRAEDTLGVNAPRSQAVTGR